MPSDAGQIPSDVVEEGGKVAKQVFEGLGETLGDVGGQIIGKKPKNPNQVVEDLRRRDEEFKKKAIQEILARLQRMKAEEERLVQKRELEKKDWAVAQREKLAPPQIERPTQQVRQPADLPQVAKQRPETKAGWGAG